MSSKPRDTHLSIEEYVLINRYSRLSVHEHVVVEAVLDGGSVAEAATVEALHGLPKDVGTGVPIHLQTRPTGSDQTRPDPG